MGGTDPQRAGRPADRGPDRRRAAGEDLPRRAVRAPARVRRARPHHRRAGAAGRGRRGRRRPDGVQRRRVVVPPVARRPVPPQHPLLDRDVGRRRLRGLPRRRGRPGTHVRVRGRPVVRRPHRDGAGRRGALPAHRRCRSRVRLVAHPPVAQRRGRRRARHRRAAADGRRRDPLDGGDVLHRARAGGGDRQRDRAARPGRGGAATRRGASPGRRARARPRAALRHAGPGGPS